MSVFDWFRNSQEPTSTPVERKKKKRSLEAAMSNRFTGDWSGVLENPNSYLNADLNVVRARSRNAVKNNEFAKRALEMYRANLVGDKGITLQNQSRNRSGKIDRPAAQAIEQAWKDWGRAKHCDISRRYTFRDIQRLVVSSIFVDGEAFIRVYKGKSASSKYKFALQVIDPALIDPKLSQDLRNGNRIRAGIEYDTLNRPVAYLVRQDNSGPDVFTYDSQGYLRIPADEILHLYLPDHADQYRGIPVQAAGLLSLHYIHEYRKTALIAARAGASAMVFVTTPETEDALDPDALYDEDDEDGSTVLNFEPMTFQSLPAGSDLKTYDTNYPSGEFVPFVKAHLQAYASSVGVSYSLLTGDLEGVNFSSLKNANAQEKEYFKGLQQFIIDHLLDPIYEQWLKQQLIAGSITIGETPLNALTLDKYLAADWFGPRWEPIDELKQASANRIRLEDGTTTVTDILRAEGKDFEDVVQRRAAELQTMKEAGLVSGTKTDVKIEVNSNESEQ